ncbi:hypothetical protein PG357_10535 [Riemerella anatipestifer]|nr:hypothetical protein [Riemerella anatipestifer]
MKNLVLVASVATMLVSCGEMNRAMFGVTEKKLIQTVSVEQGCSTENIKVLDKVVTTGNATYALDVCGKRMVYKQIGSVFMESSKADETINNLNKRKK